MSIKKIGLIFFPIFIIGGVFIANNVESVKQLNSPQKPHDTGLSEQIQEPSGTELKKEDKIGESAGKVAKKNQAENVPPLKDPFTYTTRKIICPLSSEPMLYITLEAELKFNNESDKKNVILRSNDVEALIQNVLYSHKKEDLKAPLIKKNISSSLEELIPGLSVNDIIFKDFKIEIRKK